MDRYAYIDACSDVTGVCRMNRKRVNMCPAYRDIKELDSSVQVYIQEKYTQDNKLL